MDITAHRIFLGSNLGQSHESDKALISETVEKLKTFDKEGVFQIIYSTEGSSGLFSTPQTYMYVIYYTPKKVISDCGHDFNGRRPLGASEDAVNLRSLTKDIKTHCENFFGIEWKNDDDVVFKSVQNVIVGNRNILMIKGEDTIIRNQLVTITQLSTALTIDDNMSESSESSVSSNRTTKSKKERQLGHLEKYGDTVDMYDSTVTNFEYAGWATKFLEMPRSTEDFTTDIKKMKGFKESIRRSAESVQSTMDSLRGRARPIDPDIDQGIPLDLFPRNDEEVRVFISEVVDKGINVNYDASSEKGQKEIKLNDSFVVAVIALNGKGNWSCAIIRPKSEHQSFTTTTKCYTHEKEEEPEEEASFPRLRASIGNLMNIFYDDNISESHVWMLKFLADRLAIIPTILQGDKKLPNDVLQVTVTHDMRAWWDIYDTRLLDEGGRENIINMFCVFTRAVEYTPTGTPIRLFIANIPPQHLSYEEMQQIKYANEQKLENERMQLLISIKQKFKDTAIPLAKTVPFRNRIKYFFKKTQYPTLAEVMDICKKFIKLHVQIIGKDSKKAITTYIEFFNFMLGNETTDERVNVEKPECNEILNKLDMLLQQPQLGGTHKTLKNKNGITKYKILKHKKYRTQHKVLRNKRFTLKQK